jgi:hypothetical protein
MNNPWVQGAFAFRSSLFGSMGAKQPAAGNTYDYRGTDLPNSLRGQNNYDDSMLSSSTAASSSWYG